MNKTSQIGRPVGKEDIVMGKLPQGDLDVVRGILVFGQEFLTKDEMVEVLTMIDKITMEVAIILVSGWFDGGRNKRDWEDKGLDHWIMTVLSTRIGSKTSNLLEFPENKQVFHYDCGANSVLSVLQYYGNDDVSESEIIEIAGTTEEGTDDKGVLKALTHFGLEYKAGQFTIDDLKKHIDDGYPVIVNFQAYPLEDVDIEKSEDHGHYAVAIGYENGNMILEDPISMYRILIKDEELEARWHDGGDNHYGIAVYGEPKYETHQVVPIKEVEGSELVKIAYIKSKLDLIQVGEDSFSVRGSNRRFIYNYRTAELLLGGSNINYSSHETDWKESGAMGSFEDVVKGWIGFGGIYNNGLIQFSPPVYGLDMDKGYRALNMFKKHGANNKTVVLNFLKTREQTLGDILSGKTAAVELVKIARDIMGMEFPTKEALKTYLDKHPKADKSKHTVKETQPKTKQEEKPAEGKPGKGGFSIPKHKMIDVQAEGDLGNVDKWKARVQLGNSVTKDGPKKGQMDDVGYVAISTKTNDIIPIARGDEHQSGYEYLNHLSKKGALSGKPQDYITLYKGTNYPGYTVSEKDSPLYVAAVKKWLENGGNNTPIQVNDYVTDMEDYVKQGGKLPKETKTPTKPAKEMIDLAGEIQKEIGKSDDSVVDKVRKLFDRAKTFVFQVDIGDVGREEITKALSTAKTVQDVIKPFTTMLDGMSKAAESGFSSTKGFYGMGDDAKNQIKAIMDSGKGKESPKPESKGEKAPIEHGLKPHAQESVSSFSETKRGLRDFLGDQMQEKKFINRAKLLIDHLKSSEIDIDEVEKLLTKAEADIEKEDTDSLINHLFAFDGVENFIHNYLRELKRRGEKDDPYFGDVNQALEEFNKLGQI